MKLSPAQSLILLVLIGLSISGWFYGIYWKRVASGGLFNREEKIIIQLQDQIEVLIEQNAALNEKIATLTGEPALEGKDSGAAPLMSEPLSPPVQLPTR